MNKPENPPISRLPDDAQVHVDGLGLNDLLSIYADDRDPECGNASHLYQVTMDVTHTDYAIQSGCTGLARRQVAEVRFQHGARDEAGSLPGMTDDALLAILLDRYRGFQSGRFACRENALVITKLEEAHHWMQTRARARRRQGVLGKNEPHKQAE